MRFVLALHRSNGWEYWDATDDIDEATSFEYGGPWSAMNPGSMEANHDIPVKPATPDAGVPLFVLKNEVSWRGRGIHDATRQFVIDARTTPPTILARLEQSQIDGYCIRTPEQLDARCSWDASRADFLCAEYLGSSVRYRWMSDGRRVPHPPGPTHPPDLATFARELLAARQPVGHSGEPLDVGAIRLIANLPGRTEGRRLMLFGSRQGFLIAAGDTHGMQVTEVSATGEPSAPPVMLLSEEHVRREEFRQTGEPPRYAVTTLAGNERSMWLLRIAETDGARTLYHVAIEDTGERVVANAIHLGTSAIEASDAFYNLLTDDVNACDFDNRVEGFSSPVRIRVNPLRITYDVEPAFQMTSEGPERLDDQPCVVESRATWHSGKGFTVEHRPGECPRERFRAIHVRPDGTLQVRERRVPRRR
jgi:hypothetical protein